MSAATATDGATALAVETLDALAAMGPIARPLVAGEASGRLASALSRGGSEPAIWLREASAPSSRHRATAWPEPPAQPPDSALVRLPKAKGALEMALHAAAAVVPAGAVIAVFGANAEGIRSVGTRLAAVSDGIETIAIGHHARVVAGRRKADLAGPGLSLAGWRRTGSIEIAGTRRSWVSYPGTFAGGGLDAGTALLLEHLPPLRGRGHVLDFAAGTGVVAAAALARWPEASIDMIEADAAALLAATENVPQARAILGTGLGDAGSARYDLIVSNPPVHDGVHDSRDVLDRLIREAPAHLHPAASLMLVVQRRVPVLAAMTAALADARIVAETSRYTVAAAQAPPRRG